MNGAIFLPVTSDNTAYKDEVGRSFSDVEIARAHTSVIARELAIEAGNYVGYSVCVTDHQGKEVARVSMSYVFGSMVKQWALGQSVDQADWLIGAEIMAPGFKGKALLDMANPGTAYDDANLGKAGSAHRGLCHRSSGVGGIVRNNRSHRIP